jgi:hypothetical protein
MSYDQPQQPDQPRYDNHLPSLPPYGHGPQGQAFPPPYGYGYAPIPQVIVAQSPPTSGTATAALVLGIIGAVGGWCMLGLPCLLAIVFGHSGMNETKNGTRGGRGLAVTGLILGYLFIVPWVLFFFFGILGAAVGS